MFMIYLTQSAQNSVNKEYLYLLTQTMKILNAVRLFVLVADDIRRRGPDDIVNHKKFMELILYQGANLYEILNVLKEDLLPRYQKELRDPNILSLLESLARGFKDKDETTKVLEAIRNKHAFHVPYDPYYVWNVLTDDEATEDKLIGAGEDIRGSGWFFTWDTDILFDYLQKHAIDKSITADSSYVRSKHLIDQKSKEIYSAFNAAMQFMLRGKIIMRGDKRAATFQKQKRRNPKANGKRYVQMWQRKKAVVVRRHESMLPHGT